MSLRKIGSWTFTGLTPSWETLVCQAKAYRDAENQEYRVKLFVNGAHQPAADYFTDDKDDAMRTAQTMARAARDARGSRYRVVPV